tara:strand:- start:807 stop:1253 length:447 start_codon:yes stop_codon:yes gene_type:complete
MTTINISSRPVIDEVAGTITQRVLSTNKATGKQEYVDIFLEDSKFNTVSNETIDQINSNTTVINNIANNVTLSFVVEDITDSVEDEKVRYNITNKFKKGTLCVYLNGLQISTDITEFENGLGFTLNSDYISIIQKGIDSIVATYVKDN